MKKKEIKEEEKKGLFPPDDTLWLAKDSKPIDDIWLLSLLALILFDKPKKESNTTINIYTGSDK